MHGTPSTWALHEFTVAVMSAVAGLQIIVRQISSLISNNVHLNDELREYAPLFTALGAMLDRLQALADAALQRRALLDMFIENIGKAALAFRQELDMCVGLPLPWMMSSCAHFYRSVPFTSLSPTNRHAALSIPAGPRVVFSALQ